MGFSESIYGHLQTYVLRNRPSLASPRQSRLLLEDFCVEPRAMLRKAYLVVSESIEESPSTFT